MSRAMLQTMICGGAEHVTAILKLNRVGLRSRALLTSCPFRLTNPRAASALLLRFVIRIRSCRAIRLAKYRASEERSPATRVLRGPGAVFEYQPR